MATETYMFLTVERRGLLSFLCGLPIIHRKGGSAECNSPRGRREKGGGGRRGRGEEGVFAKTKVTYRKNWNNWPSR